ncbi:MAG TPA: TonB family protein [Bacteroidia bacterium]|nr:TonB family protein [Bacteroidia bacterium]
MKRYICVFILGVVTLTVVAQKDGNDDLPETLKARLNSTQAEYPGGYEKMNKFINKQKRYANKSDEEFHVGVVAVSFIVEKDGVLDSVKVVQPLTEYYNNETMRIIKAMPKWKAATQNGKPVRTQFTLPIKF